VPLIVSAPQSLTKASFTDNGDGSGYADFAAALPDGAVILAVSWDVVASSGSGASGGRFDATYEQTPPTNTNDAFVGANPSGAWSGNKFAMPNPSPGSTPGYPGLKPRVHVTSGTGTFSDISTLTMTCTVFDFVAQ
jgi:hypothetical protein